MTELLWKSIYDFIISLTEWPVYCKQPFHGRISIYEEYIERILALVIRVTEFQKTNWGKRKIRHATVVAIFWDNCSKILRPNFNGEHFEKLNIKTAITYNSIFLCQITVYLENSRLWNQIWSKKRMITILRKRHCINTMIICGIITSNL